MIWAVGGGWLNKRMGRLQSFAITQQIAPDRRVLIAYAVVMSALSLYTLRLFLWGKVCFIGSDTFYYMSVADNLVDHGSFQDLRTVPAQRLKTPQNGIVLVHALLPEIGFGSEARLATISVFD